MNQIVGIGIDIVDIERVRKAKHQERLMEFFLTAEEIRHARDVRDLAQFIASRFAAKEAVIKACPERLNPHYFEIVQNGEKLSVRFLSAHANRFSAFISISHVPQFAAGYACVMA